MVSFDTYLKAFAAIVCLAFALIVLAGVRRGGAHVFLGAFLLLIAGNQGAETLRSFATERGDIAAAAAWFGVATVFAAFDPLALLLFGRAMTEERGSRWPILVALAASSAVAILASFVGWNERVMLLTSAILLLYTGIAYTAVFTLFLRAISRAPDDPRPRTLLYATGLVALVPWLQVPYAATAAFVGELGLPRTTEVPLRAGALSWYLVAAGVGVAILLAGRLDHARRTRRVAAQALGLGYAVGIVLLAASFVELPRFGQPIVPQPSWFPGVALLGRASAALRWIFFGALVSTAVLRDDLLGLSLARRRAAARVLVALGMLGVAGLLISAASVLLGPDRLSPAPFDYVILALVMVTAQGFRPLIDRVSARVYGVPMPQDITAAHEVYRRAVLQVVGEGRDVREDTGLARLRGELGLDATQSALVERLAEESFEAPLIAGRRVAGRYQVRRMIGRGGSGRVFLARDETLQRDVVLKEVLHDDPGDEGALAEARAAGGLQHPNVVIVHDVLRRPGSSLLVSEYVAGGSLADRVRSAGKLPLDEGLAVIDGMLAGLEAVHARGLVHRDLKPDNVLLSERGVPKLADFGIARSRRGVTARFDEPDAFVGTPEFMAPEQRAGARATAATDVYTVGLIMRECVLGPFPPAIEAVVARAMDPTASARYANAREMRAALRLATEDQK